MHMTNMTKQPRSIGRGILMNAGLACLLAGLVAANAAEEKAAKGKNIDVSKLPPAAAKKVDFKKEIKPIFDKSCSDCHEGSTPSGGFRVDKREAALKGGEHGVAIIPGKSEKSPLIHYVVRLVKDLEMPPDGSGDPLTKEQVGLLRAWIDQGAKWE